MRKRKLFFVLLLTLVPLVGWAQQKNYQGQHVSIKQTTGDSIQYDLDYHSYGSGSFMPFIKDGKVVWSFQSTHVTGWENWTTPIYEIKEDFILDNVESIDFRSFEYDEVEVRKALIEFYQAMDGDNWPEKNKKNWCSDKPIWEWYGINNCDEYNIGYERPYVGELWFGCSSLNIPTSKKIPECIQKMGPIRSICLTDVEGQLPDFLTNIYSLSTLYFPGNKLTGNIPEKLAELPFLQTFVLENNQFEGPLPEKFLLACMDKFVHGNNLSFVYNNYSGKIPKSIQLHPRFADFWPGIIIQNKPLDISDLMIPAPVFTIENSQGKTLIDMGETYKKNKFTLLYLWSWDCSWSELFNQMLVPACKAYKDKGLEVIGLHWYTPDEDLSNYLNTHDIPWQNFTYEEWSNSGHDAIFQYGGTPQIFLVDQNGNIVFNSLMDEKGNSKIGTMYRNDLFAYLEKHLGPIDYNFYTSTDYSRDGEVTTLQTAMTGQGVDLVFVGEGFTDKDIAEGMFDQCMSEALDQFFAYEPYTSLRDRFNIYAVKTVSPNAEFYGNNAKHAIDEDISKALEYALQVTGLNPNRPMRVTVVYNNTSGGRSYCYMMEDDSYVCFAKNGVDDVLNHESGGHGIGKLLDEYVESGNESLTLPEENKTELENVWTTLGWGANVDWRSNPTEVKWSKFISDPRYSAEKIGIYEGSYLYQYGAYRPTENSMMRYNDTPFNAPSREEIYKRVMRESEGEGWTYDYETFVAFDAAGHSQFVNALNTNARQRRATNVQREQHTAPPVFVKGTWRDALKKNKKN